MLFILPRVNEEGKNEDAIALLIFQTLLIRNVYISVVLRYVSLNVFKRFKL